MFSKSGLPISSGFGQPSLGWRFSFSQRRATNLPISSSRHLIRTVLRAYPQGAGRIARHPVASTYHFSWATQMLVRTWGSGARNGSLCACSLAMVNELSTAWLRSGGFRFQPCDPTFHLFEFLAGLFDHPSRINQFKTSLLECGRFEHWMGRAFKVPRKTDKEQWSKIEALWRAGYRFINHTGWRDVEPDPDRLRDVEDLVRKIPGHVPRRAVRSAKRPLPTFTTATTSGS